MRNMSFALTTAQVRQQQKTVTRRLGWKTLKPGALVQPVVKGMGLKKGETVEKIGCPIRIVNVRREPLNIIGTRYLCDPVLEGFPHLTNAEFVAMFCDIADKKEQFSESPEPSRAPLDLKILRPRGPASESGSLTAGDGMITTKEQYQNYRETAREILADNSHGVTVSEHANVQVCEDGAFVECIVWVAKDVAEFQKEP